MFHAGTAISGKIEMGIWQYFKLSFGTHLGAARIALYPLTLLFTMPAMFACTLWNCRVLWQGKWSNWGGQLCPLGALDNMVYPNVAHNFDRFGAQGRSNLMGLGDYPMGMLWYYSPTSLRLYQSVGPLLPIMGMSAWLLTHCVWVSFTPGYWVFAAMVMTLLSSGFYMSTFAQQTYHPLGWLFFPLGLAAMQAHQFVLAGLMFFLAGIFSVTAATLIALVIGIYALLSMNPALILLALPNGLWLCSKVLSSTVDTGGAARMIKEMLSLTENTKKDKRFRILKRKISKYERQEAIYFCLLYGQLILTIFFSTGEIPLLLISGLVLLALNSFHIVFLNDTYLCFIMHMSLALATALATPSLPVFASLWLFLSPLPFFLSLPPTKTSPNNRVHDIVPVYAPVRIDGITNALKTYLSPLEKNAKILALFEATNLSPKWMRHMNALRYAANTINIHIMPDVYTLMELKKLGHDTTGIEDPNNVFSWMKISKATHVMIDSPDAELPAQWAAAGFSIAAAFNWNEHSEWLEGWLGVSPPCHWLILSCDQRQEKP